jgi:hypothetical protein
MSDRNGWHSARSHIVFLLALLSAFAVVWWLERWESGPPSTSVAQAFTPAEDMQAPPPRLEALSAEEMEGARDAWAYFAANIQPDTGLANSVGNYPSTTMWDTGSFLLAAVAAERLGVLSREGFDGVVGPALESLARLPLYDGLLPNKAYDTTTLAMVDYANTPTEEGIGWSALDLGRVLVPLHVILRSYPEHAAAVGAVVDRWDLGSAVQDGVMVGALPAEGDGTEIVQEGRLGYEQYAARAFALWGFDVTEAQRAEAHLELVGVFGVEVPSDSRDPEVLGAHTHTVSEPYLLSALEFGWDARLADLAWRVYRAQERRHEETGVLTAVTEDHLNRAPFFVYSAVVANGEPWAVLTDTGEAAPDARTLSTKAAMGWDALYRTPYTAQLVEAVAPLRTAQGWGAGLFEADGAPNDVLASNTNAVILEALHWRAFGPMLRPEGLLEEREPSPAGSPLRANPEQQDQLPVGPALRTSEDDTDRELAVRPELLEASDQE